MRIVVTGLIGSIPVAGLTMHYLQYVVGLRELGHHVLYVEDTGTWYYEPVSDSMVGTPEPFVSYLASIMDRFDLAENWYFVAHDGASFGLSESRYREFVRSADVLINVTGAGILRDELLAIPRRAYVDTDPAFVQFRLAQESEKDIAHVSSHTHHFSFGCNIGAAECLIPEAGFDWIPTRQPILISFWDRTMGSDNGRFTTMMKWKSYDPVTFDGQTFGLKDIELERFVDLPGQTDAHLELAVAGNPPTDEFEQKGWLISSARENSGDIDTYRTFIHQAKGEWSVAKHAYVATRSGWFSERSACYLASSRPVIVQQTGFSDWLPCGVGIIPFSNMSEAAAAIDNVTSEYDRHCRVARELAVEYFEAATLLEELLSKVGA